LDTKNGVTGDIVKAKALADSRKAKADEAITSYLLDDFCHQSESTVDSLGFEAAEEREKMKLALLQEGLSKFNIEQFFDSDNFEDFDKAKEP
jgi:hypothetical protein